ncbi:uncharacterized protein LOC124496033 [Dermatophagoides farinae]|uniref:uncharacterized protein LOC124496033 n=1 Tax=Dermatophagoides farinae TaxID=6954 RepID=UPI003F5DA780
MVKKYHIDFSFSFIAKTTTTTKTKTMIDTFEHRLFRLSSIKHTLLVVYLVFIMILVISIITSVVLHGINPIMFLLTVFDLNSVIQLSKTLINPPTSHPVARDNVTITEVAYIVINRPSGEFIFAALILYITAIFNQLIAIVSIIRRHLCVLVFTLITNVLIFCISVNFVKTNLFLLLMVVILLTILYTIMLKQIKTAVGHHPHHPHHHNQNHYSAISHNQNAQHQHQRRSPSSTLNQNYSGGINPVDSSPVYQSHHHHHHTQSPQTPLTTTTTTATDPKILAPIIYCPHYSESVC